MHGLVRCGFVGLALAACGSSTSSMSDASPGGDGTSSTGLFVKWSTKPTAYPGDLGNDITVSTTTLRFDNLRVIGDAGGPGDPRTTRIVFSETWDASTQPDVTPFPDAPSGVYSELVFEVDGLLMDDSIEIEGTVKVDGNTKPFEIHDRNLTNVDLTCDSTLQPGGATSLEIEADFASMLGSIDFSMVEDVGGTLQLQTFDDQMKPFEQKFQQSFKVSGAGPDGSHRQ